MAATAQKLTDQDVLALPDDGRRYELLDGELTVAASPTTRHQRISKRLEFALYAAELAGYGEVFYAPFDVRLDQYNLVQPDLIFVRAGRAVIVTEERIEGVPDLLVEILSRKTAGIDQGRGHRGKLGIYERFGVPYYWVVNGSLGSVGEYTLCDGRYPTQPVVRKAGEQIVCPLFPTIRIDVADLFR
jgi:Uma2 family endonuclease